MPRNGAGVFVLLPTNPVAPGTVIATNWANPTLADIADGLTNSLDRTGLGGMTAPFRIFDGTLGAPGLAFTNETSLGIYRPSSAIMDLVSGGTVYLQIGPNRIVSPVRLEHRGYDTFIVPGSKNWKMFNNSGVMTFIASSAIDSEVWSGPSFTFNPTTGAAAFPGTVTADLFVSNTGWLFNNATVTGLLTAAGIDAEVITTNQITINAEVVDSGLATAINFETSQSWVIDLTGTLTIASISGLEVGNIGRMTFKNSNNTVNFPSTVKWPGPTFAKPDFTAGPLKRVIVTVEYDGTNYLANASVY